MHADTATMRAFVILAACGLVATAVLGVWMAWQIPNDRRLVAGLLAAGTIIPVVILQVCFRGMNFMPCGRPLNPGA